MQFIDIFRRVINACDRERLSPFAAWKAFQSALKSGVSEKSSDYEAIFLVEPPGAARQMIGHDEYLVINAAQNCHQLESCFHTYRTIAAKDPTETSIHADVVGTDQRGFVYANVRFEPMPRKSREYFRIAFEDDWQTRRPLNLAARIAAGALEPCDIQAFDPASLTNEENLRKLADWKSLVPAYDLVPDEDCWPIKCVIKPLIAALEQEPGIRVQRADCGNPTVFYSIFVHPPVAPADYVGTPGIAVYFNLLAPVAVMCRAAGELTYNELPSSMDPEIESAIDPENATGPIEKMLIDHIARTPYTLLTRQQLLHPLPPGIHPHEACAADESGDKLYHLLLQVMID